MSIQNKDGAENHFDIVIIGGGINGAGIARDAAGRGYKVCLCEAGDFGGGTSSASTKLFHGGLRYLEYFEFRLVREALIEREVLLHAMPHISWPMRFVLPYHKDMHFEGETPASRMLNFFMPWTRGTRPGWVIRLGLFLYDHMGGRKTLPATCTIDLQKDEAGIPIKKSFKKAYEYSDCWVEDSRLVVLNLQDAKRLGADIRSRVKVVRARYNKKMWSLSLENRRTKQKSSITASLVINAAGPWVDEVLKTVFGRNDANNVRLVRGSHIVIRKKYDHEKCYFFQNSDSRILFAIPYEGDYTLIGTTDADHGDAMDPPKITKGETDYLMEMASEYFREPVTRKDIVWTYSGVRPLHDDDDGKAQQASRDYLVKVDDKTGNGSLMNIFGGKITTYRKLAETMMENVDSYFAVSTEKWTAGVPLPGGDFKVSEFDGLVKKYRQTHSYIEPETMRRLVRHYGTGVETVLAGVKTGKDLGKHFGCGFYEVEARYLHAVEMALEADDYLFRRTKIGIKMTKSQQAGFANWIQKNLAG